MRPRSIILVLSLAVSCQTATSTPHPTLNATDAAPTNAAATDAAPTDATTTSLPEPSETEHRPPAISTEPPASPPDANTHFEYVRFLAGDVPIYSDVEGRETIGWTQENQLATVIDRRSVAATDWVRVQVGSSLTHHRATFGWVPRAAEVAVGSSTVHIEPVYERAEPSCPSESPTITSVGSMPPALILECYGARTLTFGPVKARLMFALNGEGEIHFRGAPPWLAYDAGYWLVDSRGGSLTGSIGMHVDPTSGITIPTDEWIEVQGSFNHPASSTCRRESDFPLFTIASEAEAILWCRQQFVASAIRSIPVAEQPPARPLPPASGALGAAVIHVQKRGLDAPIGPRSGASGVWTGSEVIVWGGINLNGERLLGDGAAYDPSADRWRVIAESPLAPQARHLATWTGNEMLVWGGRTWNYIEPPHGAAYNPETDSWRRIPDAPLSWESRATSAWTGSEWVIAISGRDSRTHLAAYDPVSDDWRLLPPIDWPSYRNKYLSAVKGQLILRDHEGYLMRLPADGDAWLPLPLPGDSGGFDDYGVNSDMIWTGEHAIAIVWQHVDHRSSSYLVGWDPSSEMWLSLPQAPAYLEDRLVWADGRALELGSKFVYDVETESWWTLSMPDTITEYGDVVVWAGDRLFVWGAAQSIFEAPHEVAFVAVPEW